MGALSLQGGAQGGRLSRVALARSGHGGGGEAGTRASSGSTSVSRAAPGGPLAGTWPQRCLTGTGGTGRQVWGFPGWDSGCLRCARTVRARPRGGGAQRLVWVSQGHTSGVPGVLTGSALPPGAQHREERSPLSGPPRPTCGRRPAAAGSLPRPAAQGRLLFIFDLGECGAQPA